MVKNSENYDEKRNRAQGIHKIIPIERVTGINLDQMKDFILGREGRKIINIGIIKIAEYFIKNMKPLIKKFNKTFSSGLSLATKL